MVVGILFLKQVHKLFEKLLERLLRRLTDAGGIRLEVLPLDGAHHRHGVVHPVRVIEAAKGRFPLQLLLFVMMVFVVVLFVLFGLRGLSALHRLFKNHSHGRQKKALPGLRQDQRLTN